LEQLGRAEALVLGINSDAAAKRYFRALKRLNVMDPVFWTSG
jgi:hypothetical protein